MVNEIHSNSKLKTKQLGGKLDNMENILKK